MRSHWPVNAGTTGIHTPTTEAVTHEQADVKAAIDWAASQPWSTGAVGMYGKSYDAITGLIGNVLDQDALKAVVAQEPIWDMYRQVRSNGVPQTTSAVVPNSYYGISQIPGMPDDDPRYTANAKYEQTHPQCQAQNTLDYLRADRDGEHWKVRDLAERAKGTDTPLFVTQGFIQDSTGTWRAQDTWPAEERSTTLRLGDGSYVDNGGTAEDLGQSRFLTWSEPLTKDTRVTGTPRISLRAKGYGNVMVRLYDVAPDGSAVMFDEHVSVLKPGRTGFDLKSTDWTLPPGHSLTVEIGSIQTGTWIDTPTNETIRVTNATLDLALDDPTDDTPTDGERAPYLDTYLSQYTVKLPVEPGTFTLRDGPAE
jgi:predicted acyl esterase